MKGLSVASLLGFSVTFVGIIVMLPVINAFINQISSYLDPIQLVAASLVGVFLLLAAIGGLFRRGGDEYSY